MSCETTCSPDQGVSTFSLLRGNDQIVGLNVTYPDGNPYNLSGTVTVFTARDGFYYSPILFQVTGEVIDAAAGREQLVFAAANTANLGSQPYWFGINLSGVSGVSTLAYGVLDIFPK